MTQTSTAVVLRKVKDQPTTVVTRTTEFVGNGDEHEELKEPYRRFVLARQRRLTGVEDDVTADYPESGGWRHSGL